jgi:hypothetical protein
MIKKYGTGQVLSADTEPEVPDEAEEEGEEEPEPGDEE